MEEAAKSAGGVDPAIHPDIFKLFLQYGFCDVEEDLFECAHRVLRPEYLDYFDILFDPDDEKGVARAELLKEESVFSLAKSALCDGRELRAVLASALGRRITSGLRNIWTGNTLLHEASNFTDSFHQAVIPLLRHELDPFYENDKQQTAGDLIRKFYYDHVRGARFLHSPPPPLPPAMIALDEAERRIPEQRLMRFMGLGAHPTRTRPYDVNKPFHVHLLPDDLRKGIMDMTIGDIKPRPLTDAQEANRPPWYPRARIESLDDSD